MPTSWPDPGPGLGQNDICLVGQGRPGRSRRRVRQHADEWDTRAVETRGSSGDLWCLDQPEQPLLRTRAAGGADGDEGKATMGGCLHGEQDLLSSDRADARAEKRMVENDQHHLAASNDPDTREHCFADATTGTSKAI